VISSQFITHPGRIGIVAGSIKYKVGTVLDPQPGFFLSCGGISWSVYLRSLWSKAGWDGKRAEGFGECGDLMILMAGLGGLWGFLKS
jgi:hypothetical protein